MGAQKSIHAGKGILAVLFHILSGVFALNIQVYLVAAKSSIYSGIKVYMIRMYWYLTGGHDQNGNSLLLSRNWGHGFPIDDFSRSVSGGVNLRRFSAGVDLNEPASSHWSSTTSIKFEHVRPLNVDGRSIADLDGSPHDTMVVLKQESRYVNPMTIVSPM